MASARPVRAQLGHLAAVALGEAGGAVARLGEQLLDAVGAAGLDERLEVPGGGFEGGVDGGAHDGETRAARWRFRPPSRTLRPRSAAGRRLLLKREDAHELGAFKWRGALPSLERYRDARRERGGDRLDRQPRRRHRVGGAAHRACGRSCTCPSRPAGRSSSCSSGSAPSCARPAPTWTRPRTRRARTRERERLPFFEDGAEPAQFEGYAAIGREIVEQLGERPALTVVPVGNGALLIGVARGLGGDGALGVVSKGAPVMALSVEAGRPVECDRLRHLRRRPGGARGGAAGGRGAGRAAARRSCRSRSGRSRAPSGAFAAAGIRVEALGGRRAGGARRGRAAGRARSS